MKNLAEAGRNRHGQRLVRVECDCGNIFEALYNNIKRGRTKTCGHCGEPNPNAIPVPVSMPEITSAFERGSIAWFDDEIRRKEAALISNENHIRYLELEIAQQEVVNLDTLKKRKAASTSANDLRQEISRLRSEKERAVTSVKKDTKSAAELTKAKIAALKGRPQ
jgi:hypothetical protein